MTTTSAILLSWQRPANLWRIVPRLAQVPWVGEILVWNNGRHSLSGLAAEVIQAPRNFALLPRLALALLARYETVLFQDDDTLLTLDQLEQLGAAFDADPERRTHGIQGRHLMAGHLYSPSPVFGVCDVVNQTVLTTRASIVRALGRLPSPFWQAGQVDQPEDDILLSLAGGRGRCVAVDVGPFERPDYDAPFAWSRRPDHLARRQAAIDWMLR